MTTTVRASSRGLVALCFASLLLFSSFAAAETSDAYTRICIPGPCPNPAGPAVPGYGGSQPVPGYGGGQPAPGYGGKP
ncbi:hypothetical protein SEVIR_6G092450v4 [Setaria viridis]|uniref:Uncharacterized protein n=1 Tax=Setaria viridis TaxID=4556 RepID=A0A4U6U4X3_SETVI|nr:hypothetical protein SEVIR_6G092450v2 [Setaria viridis]